MFSLKQEGVFVYRNVSIGTWGSVNSINLNIIRSSEVLSWQAEITADESDLEMAKALRYRVGERAANPSNESQRFFKLDRKGKTSQVFNT